MVTAKRRILWALRYVLQEIRREEKQLYEVIQKPQPTHRGEQDGDKHGTQRRNTAKPTEESILHRRGNLR